MKSEERGLGPEPAEDLGHPPVSQGMVGREGGRASLGIPPSIISPSFVGYF